MSTYDGNTSLINNYIIPTIGDTPLNEINIHFMEKYYKELLKMPAVISTRNIKGDKNVTAAAISQIFIPKYVAQYLSEINFLLPNYDFSKRQQVKVCIYGRILDENYSQILFKNPDFDLETVFLIDCVQKGIKIDKDAVKYLRKLKIIEGKIPNLFLSATISETIGEKDRYVKNKAFDDQYYKDLIVKYLAQYGSARRKDIQALLWDKLPSIMADKQKEDKIRNLLTSLRKQGIIRTDSGNQQKSSWILTDKIKQGK